MGVDCEVYLSPAVRISDVAAALGILAGLPAVRQSLGPKPDDGVATHVPGITYEVYENIPELTKICFQEPNGEYRALSYHFEAEGPEGPARLVKLRARARNIAYVVALADFFGGVVDFNDCDDTMADYAVLAQPYYSERDDEAWQAFQDRLWALPPLSPADVARYQAVASYRD